MTTPRLVQLSGSVAALAALIVACTSVRDSQDDAVARSRAAFVEVARVLRHPRCLNCHPMGDVPRVGDAARPHEMNVQRGRNNHGVPAMQCSTCHCSENQDLAHVPGAPNWHLAPLSMGWEGLSDQRLAEALKDRAKNGGRSLEDLAHHMAEDPLVLWAWEPGAGRQTPPLSHPEFVEAVETWIDNGAHSPAP